jgi:hypothetical protein
MSEELNEKEMQIKADASAEYSADSIQVLEEIGRAHV